jgi:cyclic-di-GMP phosphodiesterase TipF (flagellum assembly factor)
VAQGRFELLLQPIVTLPQRKLRFYAASVAVRAPDGEPVPATVLAALSPMLRAELDDAVLLRALQILRRLGEKGRDIGIVCPLSVDLLIDPVRSASLAEYARDNRQTAALFVPCLDAAGLEAGGADRLSRLSSLTALGIGLAVHYPDGLPGDARILAERGVRLASTDAGWLLGAEAGDIHPADLPGLYARYGIEVIATGIDREQTVADLLDTETRLACGDVFGAARPVRPDLIGEMAAPAPAVAPASGAPSQREAERGFAAAARETGRRSLARLARPVGTPRG